ncbi:MAG TPA: hypothetical protein VFI47_06070 [Acidimicrobiales bacterium]|nr:hypothetical protein [Acidimicrobiales bacterium]
MQVPFELMEGGDHLGCFVVTEAGIEERVVQLLLLGEVSRMMVSSPYRSARS